MKELDIYERLNFKSDFQSPTAPGVPLIHLHILNLRLFGVRDKKEIKRRLNLPEKSTIVSKVLSHGPYVRWLDEQLSRFYADRFEGAKELQDSFLEVVRGLRELLKSDDERVRLQAIQTYIKQVGLNLPFVSCGGDLSEEDDSDLDSDDIDGVLLSVSSEAVK